MTIDGIGDWKAAYHEVAPGKHYLRGCPDDDRLKRLGGSSRLFAARRDLAVRRRYLLVIAQDAAAIHSANRPDLGVWQYRTPDLSEPGALPLLGGISSRLQASHHRFEPDAEALAMSLVPVNVKLDQAQRVDEEIVELADWLRRSRIPGLRMRRKPRPIQPGEMGPELLPILTLVLSSTVLAELLKALHGWIASRRRKVSLELEVADRRIRIESEGTETVDDLLRRVERLLTGEPSL